MRARKTFIAGTAATALFLAVAGASAQAGWMTFRPVPGNLLVNPGAESAELVWAPTGVEARPYGTAGLPSVEEASSQQLGARAFVASADGGSLTQTVPLSGPVQRLGFGVRLGGADDAGARGLMQVELLDGDGARVVTASLATGGSLDRVETGGGGALYTKSGAIYNVPATVRSARATVTAATSGAWFDRVYLAPGTVEVPLAPPPRPPAPSSPEPVPNTPKTPHTLAKLTSSAVVRFGQPARCGRARNVALRNAGPNKVAKVELRHNGRRLAMLTPKRSRARIASTTRRTKLVLKVTRSDGSQQNLTQTLNGCRGK